jgi:hypothetical protein
VATVIKPLADYHKTSAHPASLSVFTDSRLLLRYLRGMELPFSEGIIYIFEKQIEEASLLIANKIDLLSAEDVQELIQSGEQRYPEKHIRPQNSLDADQVAEWLTLIQTQTRFLPDQSLNIDYDTYAEGEGHFAWVDREYKITFSDQNQLRSIADWIETIVLNFKAEKFKIAHLKFLLVDGVDTLKFNLTSQDCIKEKISTLIKQLDRFKHKDIKLIFNSMVEGETSQVNSIVDTVFRNAIVENQVIIEEIESFSRTPGYPKPSMRIS